ncbi:M1 family metallopeptidase [Asticcacaulis sp. 201]|uniref:M1 family metallopeptidase n=1 Tax=Asticcacaulis sp. 201 TaxID=3028787 RepID=UPI0029160FC3|nr:M1 family metallopeptidase [Asticcacaulis sp. 201]MDV6331723.1 M1 family metallopeptidase [Asticcacaulis sp. 201]
MRPAFLKRGLLAAGLLLASTALTPALVQAAPAAAVAIVPDANAPKGKLSDAARPLSYKLDLTIIPSKPRFSGHVEIDVNVKAETKSLYLHGRDLKVSKVVALVDGKTINAKYTQVDDLGVARVDFAKAVPAGNIALVFDYDAPFANDAAGLYRVQVDGQWYVWSQFESIDARAAFPSFDEPGFKTPFRVSITTDPDLVALTNAPQDGVVKADKLLQHLYYSTEKLPTYLMAFVVGPFVTAEGVVPPNKYRNHPLPIRIVATKPNAAKLKYALDETPAIVEHLENYFGQAFPYPKLDQVASPIMPGAMENAGIDIYGDNILLLADGAPTTQKQAFGMVVAHELSHQWFGDYVTPAWWDDIWLNESFANWMGFRIGNEWRPELNIGVGAVKEGFEAMTDDALKVGRPIHQPIATSGEIDSAFDKITYGKGGQVVSMIAGYLGDERFKAGVRLHMSRHPYGNATSEDFFGALADAAQNPGVLASMKSFVDQQGFPVVSFTRQGGWLVASQERYARLGTTLTPQTWTIPLCIRRGEDVGCALLKEPHGNLGQDQAGAFMPNAGGTGYYRFNLAVEDWDLLLATGDKLSGPEGVATVDSLWGQFYAGKLPAAELIKAARLLSTNPDSNVAVVGGENLAYLHERGIVPASAETDYRRVMGSIYGPRLTALGFDPKAGVYSADAPDRSKLRHSLVDLMADDARDATVRKQLSDAATAYMGGDLTALDQGYRGLAYTVYVDEGGLPAAKSLLERALTAKDEGDRSAALRAVTAGAKPDTATWVFGTLSDARLRNADKLVLIGGLMSATATRDMTYDWLKANYESFSAGAGIFSAGRIAALPGHYCSAAKADEVEQMMRAKVKAAGRGELSFDRMLESMRTCNVLLDAKTGEVAEAFKTAQ